jgi:serine phosphatase RsbU (regulator of sigma subunit)
LGQKDIIDEVKDGMDGAIISYDPINYKLVYVGAYNFAYIIRNNKIIELKADRMPISFHARMPYFSAVETNIRQNDQIYFFTDGYADQFGGPENKNFMSSQFKELLLRIHQNQMSVQKKILLNTLLDWKAKEEQVNDITVLEFRL